jgi:hypothetical protein
MNHLRLLTVLGLCTLTSGCGMYEYLVINLWEGPINCFDEGNQRRRTREQAEEALGEYLGHHPEHPYSDEFADGFVAGFRSFLDYGGEGQPPPVPPWRYRHTRDLTPEGKPMVQEWFVGYRQGAAAARASGLRQFNVVPGSGASVVGGSMQPMGPGPQGEDSPLPYPRVAPPGAADSTSGGHGAPRYLPRGQESAAAPAAARTVDFRQPTLSPYAAMPAAPSAPVQANAPE